MWILGLYLRYILIKHTADQSDHLSDRQEQRTGYAHDIKFYILIWTITPIKHFI